MLFILQVLRELTLPLITDTEITWTAWIFKFRNPKTSPLRKVDVKLRR